MPPVFRGLAAVVLLACGVRASAFNILFTPVNGQYVRHDTAQPIPYSINLGAYDTAANRADLIAGIRKAFDHVDAQQNIGLTFVYQGTTTQLPARDDISVIYLDSDRTYVPGAGATFNYKIEGPRIVTADIAIYGPGYVTSPATNLYALTLHELCHLLGLSHSSTGSDSAVFANTVNLKLSADDIAGLATLYPDPANPLLATTGTVSGRLTVAGGNPFVARVVAYDGTKGQPRIITADANADGTYELRGLPPGTYRFTAETYKTKFVHRFLDGSALAVSAGAVSTGVSATITDFGHPLLRSSPDGEAVAQTSTGRIYALGNLYGPVQAIDAADGRLLATINRQADDLALTADEKRLVVVDQIGRRLYVLDADPASSRYFQILGEIENLPTQPTHVAVTSGNLAYVCTNGGVAIVVVDLDSLSVVATITTGKFNQDIVISRDERRAYVGTFFASRYTIIEIDIDAASPSRHSILRELPVDPVSVWHVQESRDGNYLFVGTRSGLDVRRSSDYALVTSIQGGRHVFEFAQSQDGNYLAFLSRDAPDVQNDVLTILRTADFRVVERIPLGGSESLFVHNGLADGQFIVTGDLGIMLVQSQIVGLPPGRRRSARR